MQKLKYNSLGIDFDYSVPDSTTEFDSLAKQAGACLTEANRNVVYRGSLPEIRDTFLHGREGIAGVDGAVGVPEIKGVQQLSGIARVTKTVKRATKAEPDKTVEVYDETEGDYFKRVLAETKVEASHYAGLLQSVANSIAFDPSASEPKERKPKTLPKNILEKVTQLHTDGKVDKALSVITKDLGKERVEKYHTDMHALGADGAKEKKDDLLGWLIKEHAEWVSANKKGY